MKASKGSAEPMSGGSFTTRQACQRRRGETSTALLRSGHSDAAPGRRRMCCHSEQLRSAVTEHPEPLSDRIDEIRCHSRRPVTVKT